MTNLPPCGLFIEGRVLDTKDRYDLISPFSGDKVGSAARAGNDEMDRAIAAASRAFAQTRKLSRAERASILSTISRKVAERAEEFARAITLCTGKPISYARGEVSRTIGVFGLAAEETKRFGGSYEPLDFDPTRPGTLGIVERFPLGAIAAIAPFNFPLNLVTHKVAPALATGNSLVVKPPPQCPAPALALAEIATEAGLPAGAINVVSADPPVAERLATDERIKMLSFTGSARVGWALKALAPRKKVALELGGNSGSIIDETADLSDAAARVARGAFINAGQVCLSVQRIFAHRKIYREFLALLTTEIERLPVGDPMDERTLVGPLVNLATAERVMEWIDEAAKAGGKILTGGRRNGAVIDPTLIELPDRGQHALRVWREEVFGPVATIESIESFDEGITLVNDSAYGLQASVFTRDLARAFAAFRNIEVGGLIVGESSIFRVDTYPFGGVKASGAGREGVRFAMEEMTEPRIMVLNLPESASPR
jgi:acyl-CoA reductase-like NAD-dependent aldehyde dehydrogenase